VKHARGSHESDRLSGYIAGKASSVFQTYSSDNHSANELQGAIAFGIVGAPSSICHPEERRDEGSAAAFRPNSCTPAQVQHRGSREKQPQILHYVQDDKRWT